MDIPTLLANFKFRDAELTEMLDILIEPQLVGLILKDPKTPRTVAELAGALHLSKAAYKIVEYGSYRTLFELQRRTHGVYEIHIACPRASVRASRVMSLALMLYSLTELGAAGLITKCPEGKIANMIRKLGAKEVKRDGTDRYFMATLDILNVTRG